jgi:hypothetical protein
MAFVWRSIALWMLGHPEAALADADRAVRDARATGDVASRMGRAMKRCSKAGSKTAKPPHGRTLKLKFFD